METPETQWPNSNKVLNDHHNQLLLASFGADAFDSAYPKEDDGMVGRSMSSAKRHNAIVRCQGELLLLHIFLWMQNA